MTDEDMVEIRNFIQSSRCEVSEEELIHQSIAQIAALHREVRALQKSLNIGEA